jgi:hypothetical protein
MLWLSFACFLDLFKISLRNLILVELPIVVGLIKICFVNIVIVAILMALEIGEVELIFKCINSIKKYRFSNLFQIFFYDLN